MNNSNETNGRLLLRADQSLRINTRHGHAELYYDAERDEIVVQAAAKGDFLVKPRAGNAVALRIMELTDLLERVEDCTCYHTCGEDSHSGSWHQHEGEPCPIHPHAPMVG